MTQFPDQQLELNVDVALGADLTADPSTWVWTSLGNDTVLGQPRLLADPITIQRGTAVGATSAQTTSATIKALNNDGWLTPMLATSPWWPYVDAGTPIRLKLRDRSDLVDTFNRAAVGAGSWGTATSGEAWNATSSSFSTNGTQGLITFSAVNASRFGRTFRTDRDVDVVFDSTVNAVAAGAPLLLGPTIRSSGAGAYRLWCGLVFGLSGVVGLRVSVYINSVQTVPINVSVPGLTYSAGTMLRCRVQVQGTHVRMRAWLASGTEASTWTVDYAQTDVTGWNLAATATDPIFLRADVTSGVTNTLPVIYTVDNVTIAQIAANRVEGYIADVQPTFLPQTGGTTWSTVQIQIAGVGSRLEKNQSPEYSPLRRSVQLSNPPPIAYWPCEDDQNALSAASAFPGQPSMVVTGPAVFAFTQIAPGTDAPFLSRYGTKPMVSVAAGASLTGVVPVTGTTNQWAVSMEGEFYAPGVPLASMRIFAWETPAGTFTRWAMIAVPPGYLVRAYNDAAGTSTDVAVYTTVTFVGQGTYTVEAEQSGGNILVRLYDNDLLLASGSVAGTLTAVSRITGNPDLVNTTASVDPHGIRFVVGHFRVLNDVTLPDLPFYFDPDFPGADALRADFAWYRESAHRRINRLCVEERVPVSWIGNPQGRQITLLNAQRDGGFTDLITQAADSESGGLLYEDHFGYTYLPRAMRYNQQPALTINMATYIYADGTDPGDILVPQLDSRTTNYWTVTRNNGSSGSDAAPAAYRQRRGTIAQEVTVDVLYDTDLPDHASWRLHTSVDAAGANYPSTPLDLAGNPALIDAWLSCAIGSRIWRTNQPLLAGIGTIDQVITGISETISPTSWQATLTCQPGDVWNVAVLDDTVRRQDSATTSTGGSSYGPGVSPIVFSTTARADVWSTVSTPYDCICNGERFTVTSMGAVSGSGPYLQTAAVTRAVNGVSKTLPANTAINMHPDQLARFAL